jgi:hypothetical protein
MRWEGMWRIGGKDNAYGILMWKQKVTDHFEDRGADERVVLKLILK